MSAVPRNVRPLKSAPLRDALSTDILVDDESGFLSLMLREGTENTVGAAQSR
ncbi:MAG: hypothetical protein JWN70_5802 [Planctomycetaceae bacterium]|nr:hypothetical protein [Planctomycetaceae bacterium]